jgi:hypothetical protein
MWNDTLSLAAFSFRKSAIVYSFIALPRIALMPVPGITLHNLIIEVIITQSASCEPPGDHAAFDATAWIFPKRQSW